MLFFSIMRSVNHGTFMFAFSEWRHQGNSSLPCSLPSSSPRRATTFQPSIIGVSEDKPFQCDICHMTFRASSTLCDHRQIKHFGRKFPCQICDKEYVQKSTLIKHLRIHHNLVQCFHCFATYPPNLNTPHVCSS